MVFLFNFINHVIVGEAATSPTMTLFLGDTQDE